MHIETTIPIYYLINVLWTCSSVTSKRFGTVVGSGQNNMLLAWTREAAVEVTRGIWI